MLAILRQLTTRLLDKTYDHDSSSATEEEWVSHRDKLMDYYITQRATPSSSPPQFARVSPEQLRADSTLFKGSNLLCYFFSKQRKESKVSMIGNEWAMADIPLKKVREKYMYVISQSGSLYLSQHAFVHSQIKAGKPVSSAGFLEYRVDESGQMHLLIDNGSGHYQPTLMQFLLGLKAAHLKGLLPRSFEIRLNPSTTIDIPDEKDFWSDARRRSTEEPIVEHEDSLIRLHRLEDTWLCQNKSGREFIQIDPNADQEELASGSGCVTTGCAC